MQNDFSSEMAPTESDFLQMDLDAEVPAEDNFFQTVRQESDFLETTSPQNTSEQGLEDPASTPATQNDEPESGLTLTEWNYTEENGGIVLDSLKDDNATNVVVPGEFAEAPGKQVYIKGKTSDVSETMYPQAMNTLKFISKNGSKVKFNGPSGKDAFSLCYMEDFDGTGLDTSNVVDMERMFALCEYLKKIDGVSEWDTSNVTNMEYMFASCRLLSNIQELELWNTENVENMKEMFYDCNALTDISPLKNWNTSKLTDTSNMFEGCYKLKFVDLSNWDLSSNGRNVHMNKMFLTSGSTPLLVIAKDEKFSEYNYAGDNRTSVGPTFDANGGTFSESAQGGEEPAALALSEDAASEGTQIRQGRTTNWLANNTTAVDEFINTAIEPPTREDGLVFCGWEAQNLPENPNAYDRITATYKAKWGQININANDKEIEQGQAFDPLDGVTATDGNGDTILKEQIKAIGNVDVDTAGKYSITYEATDSYGNIAQKTITITVKEESQVPEPDNNERSNLNDSDTIKFDNSIKNNIELSNLNVTDTVKFDSLSKNNEVESNEENYNWLKTGNSEQIDKFAWIMLLSLGPILKSKRKKDKLNSNH